MATTILGIDPGLSGGIAAIRHDTPPVTQKMLETDCDLYHYLQHERYNADTTVVFIEKVDAGPKMGSSAAFKFGQNVGGIRMACLAAGLVINYVTPQKWQKEFGLIVKGRGLGQDDTSKKNRNKARAQELFPGLKITHAIADALLIAEYGRRQLTKRNEREGNAIVSRDS